MNGSLTPFAVLMAMPDERKPCEVGSLAEKLDATPVAIGRHMRTLLDEGLIEKTKRTWYRVTWAGVARRRDGEKARAAPPRRAPDSLRQKLWTTLRRLKKCSAPELATMVSGAHEGDAERYARMYLNQLARAGYLVKLKDSSRFLVVDDTGPLAPAFSARRRGMTDRNTGELKPFAAAGEGARHA